MQMSKTANNDVSMNSAIAGVVKLTSENPNIPYNCDTAQKYKNIAVKTLLECMSKQFSPFGFDSTEDRKFQ